MVGLQLLTRTIAAGHSQPVCVIESNAKGNAAATIETCERLQKCSRARCWFRHPAENNRRDRGLQRNGETGNVALAVRVELQGHIFKPDAPVGPKLEEIVVAVRDRQIEAEPFPAQRAVRGNDAHDAISRVAVFTDVVRELMRWASRA